MIEPLKSKSLARLKKAKGQIDGVIRMIETDKYSPDVITQTLAAQGALKAVTGLILESHLHTCGLNKLTPRKKTKFIKELLKVFKVSTK